MRAKTLVFPKQQIPKHKRRQSDYQTVSALTFQDGDAETEGEPHKQTLT